MRVAPPGREAQVGRLALPTSGRTLPLLRNRPYANPALNRVAIGAAGECTHRHAVTASVTSRQCGRQWNPGHDEPRAVTHLVRTASRWRGAPGDGGIRQDECLDHRGDAFDAVIDFDAVVRDPARPSKLQSRFASSDYIHPNDAGYRAMADAVDLGMFTRPAAGVTQ